MDVLWYKAANHYKGCLFYSLHKYLNDILDPSKSDRPLISIRYFAKKVGMDHGNLVKLLQGHRHASTKVVEGMVSVLNFDRREADYFKTLVAFNKTKKQGEAKKLFEQLITIKSAHMQKLKPGQYEYFRSWKHAAVYTLLDFYEFKGNYKALGAEINPAISAKQARESITLLENLGLVKKEKNGRYMQTAKMITTGEDWHSVAIQSFQEETLKMALHSLENDPRDIRDMSTLTMTLSQEDMQEVKEITREYRQSILRVIEAGKSADTVYQMNVQFFPLSKSKWRLT